MYMQENMHICDKKLYSLSSLLHIIVAEALQYCYRERNNFKCFPEI